MCMSTSLVEEGVSETDADPFTGISRVSKA